MAFLWWNIQHKNFRVKKYRQIHTKAKENIKDEGVKSITGKVTTYRCMEYDSQGGYDVALLNTILIWSDKCVQQRGTLKLIENFEKKKCPWYNKNI